MQLPSISSLLQGQAPSQTTDFERRLSNLESQMANLNNMVQRIVNRLDQNLQTIRYQNWTYTGPVVNGKPFGKGKGSYLNGGVYEGKFVDGKCHGHGKLTLPSKKIYIGGFNNGNPEGQGMISFPTGGFFEGTFKVLNNVGIFGTGRAICANGCVHEAIYTNHQVKILSTREQPAEQVDDEAASLTSLEKGRQDNPPPVNNRKRPREQTKGDTAERPKKKFSALTRKDKEKLFVAGKAANGFSPAVVDYLKKTTRWPPPKEFKTAQIVQLLYKKFHLTKAPSKGVYFRAKKVTLEKSL